MKKLLLIFLMLFTYLGGNAQGVWVSQATGFSTTSSGVRNIAVVDTSVVWISPYDGTGGQFPRQDFSRTIDGGAHWVTGTTTAPPFWDYAMIAATDVNNAWAVFYNTAVSPAGQGLIFHTTDGGTNWSAQSPGVIYSTAGESFPNIIHFWNNNEGVVVGDPANGEFEIYTTADGGNTWVAVPGADIPNPDDGAEAGWTTHISVKGDNIWFDTNHGRVYGSFDRGHHWNVSATNMVIPIPGTIDVCFYGVAKGIARFYDDVAIYSDVVETTDGGLTWSSTFSPVGNFFGADVAAVPGTVSMLVSTGVSTGSGFIGSSYSLDGGHNWTDIDVGKQRNALGIADSLNMWTGGFSKTASEEGIFRFVAVTPVPCFDGNINAGNVTANKTEICGGDTVTFSNTGIYGPVNGDYSGYSWALSSADISGSTNPVTEASFLGSYPVSFPAPATSTLTFINDGTQINGTSLPYGIYYWTPVVYGNATAANTPEVLQDLTLSPSCTFSGTSVAVDVLDPTLPICTGDGISEIQKKGLSLFASIKDHNTLDVIINSASSGKVSIQISDVTGRLVKNQNSSVSKGINHDLINVENLASGTYILKANVNGNNATTKVVKY